MPHEPEETQQSPKMVFVKSSRSQLMSGNNTNQSDERGEQVDTVDQLPDSGNFSVQYKPFQGGSLQMAQN